MRNKKLSQMVLKAIGANSDGLYSASGVKVPVGGKSLTIRSVSSLSKQEIDKNQH